ncbi:MAG: hypothetical protein OXI87_19445 [Albidovulum sp.]|nr:hypothetical protein [Albidovulum sp.]
MKSRPRFSRLLDRPESDAVLLRRTAIREFRGPAAASECRRHLADHALALLDCGLAGKIKRSPAEVRRDHAGRRDSARRAETRFAPANGTDARDHAACDVSGIVRRRANPGGGAGDLPGVFGAGRLFYFESEIR